MVNQDDPIKHDKQQNAGTNDQERSHIETPEREETSTFEEDDSPQLRIVFDVSSDSDTRSSQNAKNEVEKATDNKQAHHHGFPEILPPALSPQHFSQQQVMQCSPCPDISPPALSPQPRSHPPLLSPKCFSQRTSGTPPPSMSPGQFPSQTLQSTENNHQRVQTVLFRPLPLQNQSNQQSVAQPSAQNPNEQRQAEKELILESLYELSKEQSFTNLLLTVPEQKTSQAPLKQDLQQTQQLPKEGSIQDGHQQSVSQRAIFQQIQQQHLQPPLRGEIPLSHQSAFRKYINHPPQQQSPHLQLQKLPASQQRRQGADIQPNCQQSSEYQNHDQDPTSPQQGTSQSSEQHLKGQQCQQEPLEKQNFPQLPFQQHPSQPSTSQLLSQHLYQRQLFQQLYQPLTFPQDIHPYDMSPQVGQYDYLREQLYQTQSFQQMPQQNATQHPQQRPSQHSDEQPPQQCPQTLNQHQSIQKQPVNELSQSHSHQQMLQQQHNRSLYQHEYFEQQSHQQLFQTKFHDVSEKLAQSQHPLQQSSNEQLSLNQSSLELPQKLMQLQQESEQHLQLLPMSLQTNQKQLFQQPLIKQPNQEMPLDMHQKEPSKSSNQQHDIQHTQQLIHQTAQQQSLHQQNVHQKPSLQPQQPQIQVQEPQLHIQQPHPLSQQQPLSQQPHPLSQQPQLQVQQPHPLSQQQALSQQPHPLSQQQPLSQQPHPLSQQPHPLSQQPRPLSQQPHPPSQQPQLQVQQPHPPSQQPHPLSQQPQPQPQKPHSLSQQHQSQFQPSRPQPQQRQLQPRQPQTLSDQIQQPEPQPQQHQTHQYHPLSHQHGPQQPQQPDSQNQQYSAQQPQQQLQPSKPKSSQAPKKRSYQKRHRESCTEELPKKVVKRKSSQPQSQKKPQQTSQISLQKECPPPIDYYYHENLRDDFYKKLGHHILSMRQYFGQLSLPEQQSEYPQYYQYHQQLWENYRQYYFSHPAYLQQPELHQSFAQQFQLSYNQHLYQPNMQEIPPAHQNSNHQLPERNQSTVPLAQQAVQMMPFFQHTIQQQNRQLSTQEILQQDPQLMFFVLELRRQIVEGPSSSRQVYDELLCAIEQIIEKSPPQNVLKEQSRPSHQLVFTVCREIMHVINRPSDESLLPSETSKMVQRTIIHQPSKLLLYLQDIRRIVQVNQ